MSLTATDFTAFWQAVNSPDDDTKQPFDWQQRLARRVAERGWPEVLDVPTGLGKTTALDIAVFNLAMALEQGRTDVPRRIFMVIDRRVVVDQSFEHARRIQAALETAEAGILAEVRQALVPPTLEPTKVGVPPPRPRPLVVGRMRGGVHWSWRWLDRPDQPAVIVGTIDQIGSRLLFGGYGVGSNLRSIDAALTGSDSLVLIDEAHLAEPFRTTLDELDSLVEPSEPLASIPMPRVVIMSATTRDVSADRFGIDLVEELSHPLARRRLQAPKRVHLLIGKVTKKRRVTDTAAILASAGRRLGEDNDVVGIVCNTVAVARAVFDALADDDDIGPDDVVLITGRQRQVDREAIWRTWGDRLGAGRLRHDGATRYAVATQTIEVGADLDFSAMVSESASFDALTQRLGRLNRRGAWNDAPAIIVHPNKVDDGDPIYGPARNATWEWLTDLTEPDSATPRTRKIKLSGPVDMSPVGLLQLQQDLDREVAEAIVPQSAPVPVLFRWMLDTWTQTSPAPLNAPPLHPFLHGRRTGQPSVEVLWRHTSPRDVTAAGTRHRLAASIEILPPSPGETMEVPLWAVRAWLAGNVESASDVSDLESANQPEDTDDGDGTSRGGHVICVRDGDTRPLHGQLQPGDRVVAPTWIGGCDAYGWNPASSDPVTDVADLTAHRMRTGRWGSRNVALRLQATTLSSLLRGGLGEQLQGAITDLLDEDGAKPPDGDLGRVLDLLQHASSQDDGPLAPTLATVVEHLQGALDQGNLRASVQDLDELTGARPGTHDSFMLVRTRAALDVWVTDRGVQSTSATGSRVSLDAHQEAVGLRAREFAVALGLPEHLVGAVHHAARQHDQGKTEPRFQQMLNGGAFPPTEHLAKSGMNPTDGWAFRRVRQLAGYPAGMRHEVHSAAIVHAATANYPEQELVTHLVASHHGRGRALATAVEDPGPVTWKVRVDGSDIEVSSDEQIDWAQPARFAALNERFGPWGLALLETIVRLADIGCSEEGS